jgi:hypothetical protein
MIYELNCLYIIFLLLQNLTNCQVHDLDFSVSSVLFQVQFCFRHDFTSVSVSDGNWQQMTHGFSSDSVCYNV